MIISFEEDFPKTRFSNRIVFEIEFVKAVERVAMGLRTCQSMNVVRHTMLPTCMSRVSMLRS